MPRPATPVGVAARDAILERLQTRDRLTAEYPIILSDQAAEAVREAARRLDDAEVAFDVNPSEENKRRLEVCRQAAADARDALKAETVVLRFEGLPRSAFRKLLDDHKPPAENDKDGEPKPSRAWDDTFPEALVAATCIDPGFDSVSHAAEFLHGPTSRLSETEATGIFEAAISTCVGARGVPDAGKD